MNPEDLRSYANRDWDLIARSKARFWRELFEKEGAAPALEASGSLFDFATEFHADWPTDQDRTHDLESHIRVSTLMSRAARLAR